MADGGDDEFDDDDDTRIACHPGEYALDDVLRRYYDDGDDESMTDVGGGGGGCVGENYFLADVELSFLLFLYLECHASLEYWRDAISMCSLATMATTTAATTTTTNIVFRRSRFYRKLLSVLYNQLSCIETNFFREEVEYSSGEDNFLIDAIRRLCDASERRRVPPPGSVVDGGAIKRKRDDESDTERLRSASRGLRRLVRDRFGVDLSSSSPMEDVDDANDDFDDADTDALGFVRDCADDGSGEDGMEECNGRVSANNGGDDVNDDGVEGWDEDDDGPVIIPYEEIEASIARSAEQTYRQTSNRYSGGGCPPQGHRDEYPLLYAAMSPGEDEVMACARILDEAGDVSLVREAAAYLEEVEIHRGDVSLT